VSQRPNRIDLDFALREARQKATAFLERFHPSFDLPVDPFDLARKRRIEVTWASGLGDGVLGQLDVLDGKVVVTLSSDVDHEGMMRFTMAHELGHHEIDGHFDAIFADDSTRHQCRAPYASVALHERQADAFAAELLMPSGPCRRFLAKLPEADDGIDAILKLADRCQVSLQAAANRYIDLVERPTALIVSRDGIIDYCLRSDELRKRISRSLSSGDALPVHAKAARMSDGDVRRACRTPAGETRWCHWFGGSDQSNVQEEAIGLGRYGKIMTVLSDNDWGMETDDDEDSDN
jgi:hypothetical protein